jgi:hypothetical protein
MAVEPCAISRTRLESTTSDYKKGNDKKGNNACVLSRPDGAPSRALPTPAREPIP